MHSGSADPGGGVFHHTQENLDIPPLSTLRLQPTRHKTKNAILSILQSGEVVLEFVKLNHRFHEERVVDVCRISADGLRIVLYHPETGQIVGTEPPALPTNGADHLFSHDNLPAKHWKKYLYAARFIEMVKAKTPKVTFYSSKAKSQLMESGRDFEANFYDGCKIVKSKDSQILTDSSGAEVNLHYDQLPNHLKNIWSHAEQCLDHCQKLERINESQEMTLPCFPLIVGRRPPNSSNTSSPVLRSTENTFNNYLSSSQTPVRPPVIQMPSYSDLKDTFPGSLKNLQNLQRPLSNFTRNIYIPAIGFAAHLPDGLVQIQYIEGSQMTILPDGILFNSAPNQPTIHYKETDVMPESVRVKFQQIPSILKELMGGREKEVVTSTPCGRGRRYIR